MMAAIMLLSTQEAMFLQILEPSRVGKSEALPTNHQTLRFSRPYSLFTASLSTKGETLSHHRDYKSPNLGP